jgi:hypothetical protein
MVNFIEEIKIVNNYKPLYLGELKCLSYKKGELYTHTAITETPKYLGSLPLSRKQKFLSQFRFTERLFRLEPRVAVSIDDTKFLVSHCGAVYSVDSQSGVIHKEHNFRQGMNNPLSFCTINNIKGFDDCILYGEYWGNIQREAVSIYARRNGNWEKAFTFPKSEIQHIHQIVPDPYRNCVLILTGDKDSESGIWVARNNFKEVKPLLIGSQRYRSCVAFPVEEGIIYATDSPLEQNFIAIAKIDKNVWKEKILFDIPGPCIYGADFDGKYLFATSVEPDSRIEGIRYLFTYRLGKGVKDRNSHLIIGNLNEGFKSILSFKKDNLPITLFQFGNIQFPSGAMKQRIVMYPISVRKYEGKTVILKN